MSNTIFWRPALSQALDEALAGVAGLGNRIAIGIASHIDGVATLGHFIIGESLQLSAFILQPSWGVKP